MQSVHITTAFMSSAIYSRLERTPAAIFIQQHRHHSHGRTCTQRHSIHWDDIERLSLSRSLCLSHSNTRHIVSIQLSIILLFCFVPSSLLCFSFQLLLNHYFMSASASDVYSTHTDTTWIYSKHKWGMLCAADCLLCYSWLFMLIGFLCTDLLL